MVIIIEDLFISKNKTFARDIPLLQRLMDEKKSYKDITLKEKRIILSYHLDNSLCEGISKDISKECLNQIFDYCKQIGESIVDECSNTINSGLYFSNVDLLLSTIKLIKKYYIYFDIDAEQLESLCKDLSYQNLLFYEFDYMSFNLKISILKKIQFEVLKANERNWIENEREFYKYCVNMYENLLWKYTEAEYIDEDEKEFIYCFTRTRPLSKLLDAEKDLVLLTITERDFYASHNEKLVPYAISNCIAGEDKYSDDVLGDGFEGLAKALVNFRKDYGYEFTTYAYKCIVRTIQYSKRKYNSKNRTSPKDSSTTVLVSSLDETISNKNDVQGETTKLDLLMDNDAISVEEEIENKIIEQKIAEIVNEMLSHLTSQEEIVLRYRFGIGTEKKRQIEIAEMLNTTQSYVHQLEKRGKDKIYELYCNNPSKAYEIAAILK